MKKINNKYRPNSNSSQFSLNYKFDSISAAGKISGTALELIKKYNELAKEAHSNGNYTEMETFRQYAEHYRKIVTDINEKKNSFRTNNISAPTEAAPEKQPEPQNLTVEDPAEEKAVETPTPLDQEEKETKKRASVSSRKTFKIVEIAPEEKPAAPRKRICRKKADTPAEEKSAENTLENSECANS